MAVRVVDHPTEIDGEPILLSVELSEKWKSMRACTCCCVMTAATFGAGAVTIAPLYLLLCGGARQAEADSFYLYLTPTALHARQKIFQCGCCCQTTETKVIPVSFATR